MDLLDRCKAVRTAIERRDALVREVNDANKFSTRAQEIQAIRTELTVTVGRLGVLNDHHISLGKVRSPTDILARLSTYQEKLKASPAESGSEHGLTKRSLAAIQNALAEAAERALGSVIQQLPNIEETFLRAVEANPVYARQVARIRAMREELRRDANVLVTAEQLDSFLNKREELRTLAEELKPQDFPREVLEFFKAARNGAPLDKLTEGVRKWFADRDQLKNVRVFVIDK
jgi:hypothetical protein